MRGIESLPVKRTVNNNSNKLGREKKSCPLIEKKKPNSMQLNKRGNQIEISIPISYTHTHTHTILSDWFNCQRNLFTFCVSPLYQWQIN